MSYQVWSMDGFDFDAEPFHLDGKYVPEALEIKPEYETQDEALAAARRYLRHLNEIQPSAGGQGGIQDRVYVRHPDGRLERIFS